MGLKGNQFSVAASIFYVGYLCGEFFIWPLLILWSVSVSGRHPSVCRGHHLRRPRASSWSFVYVGLVNVVSQLVTDRDERNVERNPPV